MLNVKKTLNKMLRPFITISTSKGSANICGFLIVWDTNTQSVSSASSVTWNTTFAKQFSNTPVVFTQITDTTAPQTFHVSVENVSTTGCTFRRTSTSATSYNCTIVWVAIGKAAV